MNDLTDGLFMVIFPSPPSLCQQVTSYMTLQFMYQIAVNIIVGVK